MPSTANVHPSWRLEVINKCNKIIIFVHTEVITNIFGIQLTMFGKENQVRLCLDKMTPKQEKATRHEIYNGY